MISYAGVVSAVLYWLCDYFEIHGVVRMLASALFGFLMGAQAARVWWAYWKMKRDE